VRDIAARARQLGERLSGPFDRLPIRTRLAAASALLTFAILCSFAVVVGALTAHRLRSDFDHQVAHTDEKLAEHARVYYSQSTHEVELVPSFSELALPEGSVVEVLNPVGTVIARWPSAAPTLTLPSPAASSLETKPFFAAAGPVQTTLHGYRVASEPSWLRAPELDITFARITIEYARPVSSADSTVARVEFLLILGVLAGTGLALLAGVALARRAMRPIAALTSAAAQIARTRDSSLAMPASKASDEVSELGRTLAAMLGELDAAQAETEATLARQRQFVADASHELRTPLTSVLANLELLAESLQGEQGEAAQSALRASRRMRRLVADLLLLARNDVPRAVQHRPVDLAAVALDAASELGPMSATHHLSVDAKPVVVDGSRDELDRVAINLIENAVRHTPPGTRIWVSTGAGTDGSATLVVEDDGPGVASDLAPTLFDRFVRGAGDAGGSFGLGLAIVRAVSCGHGGAVTLEHAHRPDAPTGARFVVRLPLGNSEAGAEVARRQPQTSTTTGSTTGRLRRRS
jgi:signal transduction histidine kinase